MGENSTVVGQPAVPEDFFKDIKFYIIGNVDPKVPDLLIAGGAKQDHYLSQMVTHAIADTDLDDEVNEAKELFELPVVTSQWVTLSIKCGVHLPNNAFKPDSKKIFTGVVACPSQVSREDQKNIWAMLTVHGGKCQAEFNRNVTHLITTNTAGAKFDIATRHSDKVFIVTPDWVTESVSKGAQEDAKRYHPRLLVFDIPEKKKPPPKEFVPPSSPSKSITPPAIGPPMLLGQHLNTPPRTESSRAKEALAKSIYNRQRHSYGPPVPDYVPVGPGMGMYPGVPPPMSPRTMMPPGMRMGSPRNMLRNITNEGKTPKSPKSPRSPGRAKISQLVSTLNRPPRQMSPSRYSNISHQLNLNRPLQPEAAVCYGHDPNEIVPEDVCLIGCVFYITDYQKLITPEQMATWKKVIEQHGGNLDESYSNRVTHVLCVHQKSDVFQLALRDGKRLVTAYWLNDCLMRKKMVPPWLALHFPSCYAKEKPASNQSKVKLEYEWNYRVQQNFGLTTDRKGAITPKIISVTNFEGVEREKIKAMIGCLGAKYTGYLTRANSVLISKKLSGQKCEKAMEWRIHTVNVQWLSDLLLGDLNALKLPINAKYLNFNHEDPFRIDTWKVCHLLEGWKTPIKISKEMWKKFNPSQHLKSSQGSSHSLSQPPSSQEQATPPAGSVVPTPGTSQTLTGPTAAETTPTTGITGTTTAAHTKAPSEGATSGDVRENGEGLTSQSSATSQSTEILAKDADGTTVQIKQEPMDVGHSNQNKRDLHNGEESKQGSGVKRKADDELDSAEKKLKLEIPDTPMQNHHGDDAHNKENCPASPPVVIITGFTKSRARQLTNDITKLGGQVVTSPSGATHLISSSISRTVKFLTALSVVKHVVAPEWIEMSAQEGKLLPEESYGLKDENVERTFNFKLTDSIKRANGAKLFKDLTFYITPGIYPSKNLLTDIIQSASGTVVEKRPSTRAIAGRVNAQGQPTFVVISCQNDIHLCKDLLARKIPVHNAEFVLTGVMRQEINFQVYQLPPTI